MLLMDNLLVNKHRLIMLWLIMLRLIIDIKWAELRYQGTSAGSGPKRRVRPQVQHLVELVSHYLHGVGNVIAQHDHFGRPVTPLDKPCLLNHVLLPLAFLQNVEIVRC